jgi:antibiotic biosynthesis monooxygenase (ABM) superfamily enzyme
MGNFRNWIKSLDKEQFLENGMVWGSRVHQFERRYTLDEWGSISGAPGIQGLFQGEYRDGVRQE